MTLFAQYFILVCVSDWQCCERYELCNDNAEDRSKQFFLPYRIYKCGTFLRSDDPVMSKATDVQFKEKCGRLYYFLINVKWNLKIPLKLI